MKNQRRLIVSILGIGLLVACALPGQVLPTHPPAVQASAMPPQPTAPAATTSVARPTPQKTGRPAFPTVTPQPSPAATSGPAATEAAGAIRYVGGSTQKVCQLVGETDKEFNTPTVNQTESRFGLVGNDLGYSFEHNSKLFFLFGDSMPSSKFKGKPNGQNDRPRNSNDNDAIAFTTDTSPDPCVNLNFIQYPNGAFRSPVVLNAQGLAAITLRVDEVPVAGISDGGKMFVVFATDNYVYPAEPSKGQLGYATRTAVGVSDDDANTFHYLYDFSKGAGAKFINVAIAQGQDGFLYFWGTQGGRAYRKSAAFLARKPVGSLSSLNPIEYLHSVNPDGTPNFTGNESDAVPLFHDYGPDAATQNQVNDCMGELGVAWNPIVKRWVMLYNCLNNTPANPRGIYMRVAEQPWGPWSVPQTIFNPDRDKGYCYFMHRAVTDQNATSCDNLSGPNTVGEWGGEYGPYIISRFTTGDAENGTSTLYYTLSTWIPYTEVIMKSTIQFVP